MDVLDKLKEQRASETSEALMSRLEDVEEQTRQLTNAVNKVSGFLKAMDEAQSAEIKRLSRSISQQHEQPSQTQLDDETKNRLSEIEKTLSAIAEQLSASGAVKLNGWKHREAVRSGLVLDDEAAQQRSDEDDFGLG